MGLAANQANLVMLAACKSNLELELQFVQQARIQIATCISSLFVGNSQLDPNTLTDAQCAMLDAAVVSLQARGGDLTVAACEVLGIELTSLGGAGRSAPPGLSSGDTET